MQQPTHAVILFDGVCNLCSSSVQFIIQHDPKKQFRFASLQGNFGQEILGQYQLPTTELNSFILWDKGIIYFKSTGALKVARKLSGAWPLLFGLIIIPPFIRNGVYNFVAKNRYKWFGKNEVCWMPTPPLKELFID